MQQHEKIYVAGHRGLVGSAIVRALTAAGYTNLIYRTHAELDLTDPLAVAEFFETEKPDYVFLAAAKVGGIHANNSLPAEFIYQNLQIQTNVIHEAWKNHVKRLLFLGSSCIYPRECPQPMKEAYLLTGPLEVTNRPYALAKIAGIEMCWAYNRQYGTQFVAAMPTNLYGPNDNYDLNHSHVIPAMIRKMHEAKLVKCDSVELWGTGKPRREFLYSDDLADACLFLMNLNNEQIKKAFPIEVPPIINVGWGEDIQIKELAELISETVRFTGTLSFNTDMPDGTPIKLLSIKQISSLGWLPRVTLKDGLELSYQDFLQN